MESNRVSNKGSITSLMQDPRQTLEHMFSDQECLVQKYLATGQAFKSVSQFQEKVSTCCQGEWTHLCGTPTTFYMDMTKKSVSTRKAFMSNVMPSKMVTNVQCSEF